MDHINLKTCDHKKAANFLKVSWSCIYRDNSVMFSTYFHSVCMYGIYFILVLTLTSHNTYEHQKKGHTASSTEKRLCTNPVKFLVSMLSALLSNSFEPRCSFLTVSFRRHFYLLPVGSVSIISFSQKLMLALEKPV